MDDMTTPTRPRARAAAPTTLALGVGLTVALTAAMVLVAVAPAGAHSELADSTPAEGETLTQLPESFSVTANEPLLDLGGQGVYLLQIRDAAGDYYGDGCVEISDATLSATPALGSSGDYTMIWQIVSADGHPVSGELEFMWDAPADFEAAESFAEPPVCGEDPDAAPTGEPAPSAETPAPWVLPVTIGLGLLVVILIVVALAMRSARLRLKKQAADRPQTASDD